MITAADEDHELLLKDPETSWIWRVRFKTFYSIIIVRVSAGIKHNNNDNNDIKVTVRSPHRELNIPVMSERMKQQ